MVLHSKSGQGATEYLVILSAVLIIVLMVVYVLNTSTSIGNQNTQSMYQSYWSSLNPFSITDATQGPLTAGVSVISVAMQNVGPRELVLQRITLSAESGAYSYSNQSAIIFLPGQKRTVYLHADNQATDCASYSGKYINRYSVFLVYDDDPLTGKVFNSSTKYLSPLCFS